MRRTFTSSLLALVLAATAHAAEPPCPLDVATCLAQYERFKVRPWLGITFENDSTGRILVAGVEPTSPSDRGGLRAGDEIKSIDGLAPKAWFMAKAGWKPKDRGKVQVVRDQKLVALEIPYELIPEERFARMVGFHMVAGHLAHMPETKP